MRDAAAVGGRLLAVLLALLTTVGAADAQTWRTVSVSRQVTDEEELDVEVHYGAGRFDVRAAEPGVLYQAELRYDEERFRPVTDYRAGSLEVGTETVDDGIHLGRGRSSGSLSLALARDLPMHLELRFGAVRADLDLGGLALTDLRLSTGASESRLEVSEPNPVEMRRARLEIGAAEFTTRHLGNLNAERIEVDAGVGEVVLDLTGEWRREGEVEVDMGLGSLEIRLPEGLGVMLTKDSFLTSLDSQGMIKRGDAYYSEDWETADRRVTVDVDAALGSIRVVWVR